MKKIGIQADVIIQAQDMVEPCFPKPDVARFLRAVSFRKSDNVYFRIAGAHKLNRAIRAAVVNDQHFILTAALVQSSNHRRKVSIDLVLTIQAGNDGAYSVTHRAPSDTSLYDCLRRERASYPATPISPISLRHFSMAMSSAMTSFSSIWRSVSPLRISARSSVGMPPRSTIFSKSHLKWRISSRLMSSILVGFVPSRK